MAVRAAVVMVVAMEVGMVQVETAAGWGELARVDARAAKAELAGRVGAKEAQDSRAEAEKARAARVAANSRASRSPPWQRGRSAIRRTVKAHRRATHRDEMCGSQQKYRNLQRKSDTEWETNSHHG